MAEIEFPDGSMREATPENILLRVKERLASNGTNRESSRFSISTNGVSQDTNRYATGVIGKDGNDTEGTQRRGIIDASDPGGYGVNDGESTNGPGREYEQNGRYNHSSNEYHQQSPGTDHATQQQPVRKSKFAFFNELTSKTKQAVQTEYKERSKKKDDTPPRVRAKTMTDTEVIAVRDNLIETIEWISENADQFIIATTKGHDITIVIWSDLDHHQCGVLADFLLERSRVDKRVAGTVYAMLRIQKRIELAMIVIPRATKTIQEYFIRGIGIAFI